VVATDKAIRVVVVGCVLVADAIVGDTVCVAACVNVVVDSVRVVLIVAVTDCVAVAVLLDVREAVRVVVVPVVVTVGNSSAAHLHCPAQSAFTKFNAASKV